MSKVPRLDISIPVTIQPEVIKRRKGEDGEEVVEFTFLTKKSSHSLEVPADTEFTSKVLSNYEVSQLMNFHGYFFALPISLINCFDFWLLSVQMALQEREETKRLTIKLEEQARQEEYFAEIDDQQLISHQSVL